MITIKHTKGFHVEDEKMFRITTTCDQVFVASPVGQKWEIDGVVDTLKALKAMIERGEFSEPEEERNLHESAKGNKHEFDCVAPIALTVMMLNGKGVADDLIHDTLDAYGMLGEEGLEAAHREIERVKALA